MKAIAQALTFKDIAVIRGALLDDIARTDLPIDTEPMKEALKKVDRVIDDMRYQQCNNTYFLIIPVVLEENIQRMKGAIMKAIAQALTFKDIAVIRGALLDDIARTDLPIDTEPMKEALKKVDRVIDDMRYQQCNNTYFLIIPVVLEEIIKE